MKQKFVALIEEHKGIISRVCNIYCSYDDDPEYLFQDVVLQLWRSFPTFSNVSKITTWMYRIALNVAITRLRKDGKRERPQELDDIAYNIPDKVFDN